MNADQYFKQAAIAEAMVEEMIDKFLIANPRAQHTRKGWQEYLDEQEKEKEDYNLQAKRMGWTYKTAYGILIPGPNFLPNFDYTDEWMISDELWQTWTAKEKVGWVIRHG